MDNLHLAPYGVKDTLNRHLGLRNQELRDVRQCPSGFALYPKDQPTQMKLLALEEEIIRVLKAKKVETHIVWVNHRVGGCPRRVMSAEGLTIEITEKSVSDEAEDQTGERPVRCILSRQTTEDDFETTWLISFAKKVQPFRLFGCSWPSKREKYTPKVQQCNGCFRFHGSSIRCEKKTCP